MNGQWLTLKDEVTSDVNYIKGLTLKGQANGSSVGYWIDTMQKYLDLTGAFTDVYNNCDLDYYMQATSRAVSNVSGLTNQVVNTFFRVYIDTDIYAELATEIAAKNTSGIATQFGVFLKDFLMVEIPDVAEQSGYQQADNIMQ